jgi:hypothetical protein
VNRNLKTAILLCIGVTALAIGSAARGDVGASSVVFKLRERHDSGASGTATLTTVGRDLRIVLRLQGPLRGRPLAHIHTGPCRREPTFANPRIWISLNDVAKGKSVTVTARTSLEQLRARAFSINVHDPRSLGVIACGDIPPAK